MKGMDIPDGLDYGGGQRSGEKVVKPLNIKINSGIVVERLETNYFTS
jgi:hypothetical protein